MSASTCPARSPSTSCMRRLQDQGSSRARLPSFSGRCGGRETPPAMRTPGTTERRWPPSGSPGSSASGSTARSRMPSSIRSVRAAQGAPEDECEELRPSLLGSPSTRRVSGDARETTERLESRRGEAAGGGGRAVLLGADGGRGRGREGSARRKAGRGTSTKRRPNPEHASPPSLRLRIAAAQRSTWTRQRPASSSTTAPRSRLDRPTPPTLRYAAARAPRREEPRDRRVADRAGPADYVLFVGSDALATVEAKRKNLDVSGSLQQAKRYSRGFTPADESRLPAALGQSIGSPSSFPSNGRPYLRQLATHSGIWFCDLRRADNLGHALDGWYTPEGLDGPAQARRASAPTSSSRLEPLQLRLLALRHYQQARHSGGRGRHRGGSARCCWPWRPAPARPRPASR